MPVSVMRLTNINKGIIKLLPQIVTLIILITAIPQLAKLTWRVVFPVSPEDISALPLTMPPAADPELKNVRPAFTLFGLAVKNSPTPTDAASLNQVPVSSLKLRLAGLLASSNPARSIAIIEKGNQQVSLSTTHQFQHLTQMLNVKDNGATATARRARRSRVILHDPPS